MKKAICKVIVGGVDVTENFRPFLISLSVCDKAGLSSDTASIELDDSYGQLLMPSVGAKVEIMLGWVGQGIGTVFRGTVDDVQASGGRKGRTLSIGAKGMDTRSKVKQGQRRHFDDATIESALSKAGQFASVDVKVDPAFASISRPYIALDDESFVAFGERLARELGGTFKIVGDKAVLAKRNGGTSPFGEALPTVTAMWGSNLHDYSISPLLGRPVEQQTLTRWFDKAAAKWKKETADTGTEGGKTTKQAMFSMADDKAAKEHASSGAAEMDRRSGSGSVTIEGNIDAQPEGVCIVGGCRPGVDGQYRIEGVTHTYSRSGFITQLELKQPKGAAGKDNRSTDEPALPSDLALPAHETLG